ncbi:MAG TPA: hypothetical protein VFV70_02535 [Hyphomonadaceae bacterium]|nr:hypothetical protein [Hyphomonadaceae bacterium]
MALFNFDYKESPLASPVRFAWRMLRNIFAALVLVGLALGAGIWGYHETEGMSWLDAFLNSAMLLGGMGPVTPLATDAGKLFAGVYALVCGLVFVLASGVVLAPVFHRVLHALHVDDDTD